MRLCMNIEKIKEALHSHGFQEGDYRIEEKRGNLKVTLQGKNIQTWSFEMPKSATDEQFISRLNEVVEFYLNPPS